MEELVGVYVNSNSYKEYGDQTEVNDGVNEYRQPTRLHVSELNHPGSSRKLEQQSRC